MKTRHYVRVLEIYLSPAGNVNHIKIFDPLACYHTDRAGVLLQNIAPVDPYIVKEIRDSRSSTTPVLGCRAYLKPSEDRVLPRPLRLFHSLTSLTLWSYIR